MKLDAFKSNLQGYADKFNTDDFFSRIQKYAKKAGVKTVFVLLMLYYAAIDSDTPIKDKLMLFAALGYFISPIDIIPDMLPAGLTDDFAVAMFALKLVWDNITPGVRAKAEARLREWFDDITAEDLILPKFD